MTRKEIETLNAGSTRIARQPAGYWCLVLLVDKDSERVKIRDDHSPCHRYWVSFKTLADRWRANGA